MAFTVEWEMSASGEIHSQWFGRSVIRSAVKLAYEHAQDMLDDPQRVWSKDELPEIRDPFQIADIVRRVNQLNRVALNLKQRRVEAGCLKLDNPKMCFKLDKDTGLPLVSNHHHHRPLKSTSSVRK